MHKIASTPPHHRIYAIGDIHGRLDLLTRLLSTIEADAIQHEKKHKKLVFLGDYIDRGLDSRGVIERLMAPFAKGIDPIFIRGNHDDRMIRFLDGQLDVAAAWLQLGGAATFASYGINAASGAHPEKLESLHRELKAKVPAAHLEFLQNTVMAVSYGDFYFVHAGVKPSRPLSEQRPEDQMWIRGDFLFSDEDFGKIVVHGHTICPQPEAHANRIAIDTGAFATGCLTCLILDGQTQSFMTT